jgi:predicted nucleotidyltransferase
LRTKPDTLAAEQFVFAQLRSFFRMQDFVDLIEFLNDANAAFIVVGSFAMAHFGYVRATGDIDLFVEATILNSERIFEALQKFGAPLMSHGIDGHYFSLAGKFYQLGVPPNRIDILTQISDVSFAEALSSSVKGKLGDCSVNYMGLENLIKNKTAAGRSKDLIDVAELLKLLLVKNELK